MRGTEAAATALSKVWLTVSGCRGSPSSRVKTVHEQGRAGRGGILKVSPGATPTRLALSAESVLAVPQQPLPHGGLGRKRHAARHRDPVVLDQQLGHGREGRACELRGNSASLRPRGAQCCSVSSILRWMSIVNSTYDAPVPSSCRNSVRIGSSQAGRRCGLSAKRHFDEAVGPKETLLCLPFFVRRLAAVRSKIESKAWARSRRRAALRSFGESSGSRREPRTSSYQPSSASDASQCHFVARFLHPQSLRKPSRARR